MSGQVGEKWEKAVGKGENCLKGKSKNEKQ